jgi:hypothetical protein
MGISQHSKTTSPTCLVHVSAGSFGYYVSHMGVWVELVRVLLGCFLLSLGIWIISSYKMANACIFSFSNTSHGPYLTQ